MQRSVKRRGQNEMPDGEETRGLRHSVTEKAERAFSHAVEDAGSFRGDVTLYGLDQSGGEKRRHEAIGESLQAQVTR